MTFSIWHFLLNPVHHGNRAERRRSDEMARYGYAVLVNGGHTFLWRVSRPTTIGVASPSAVVRDRIAAAVAPEFEVDAEVSTLESSRRYAGIWIVDTAALTVEPTNRITRLPHRASPRQQVRAMMTHRQVLFVDSLTVCAADSPIYQRGYRMHVFQADHHTDDFGTALRRRLRRSRADPLCSELGRDLERYFRCNTRTKCGGNTADGAMDQERSSQPCGA